MAGLPFKIQTHWCIILLKEDVTCSVSGDVAITSHVIHIMLTRDHFICNATAIRMNNSVTETSDTPSLRYGVSLFSQGG